LNLIYEKSILYL